MNIKEKIRRKVEIIERCFNEDVYKYVNESYGSEYAEILNGEFKSERLLSIINTCKKKEKWTSPINYAKDVVLGWVVEDFMNIKINNLNGFKSKLDAMDRDREFIRAEAIISSPDLLIKRERIQADNGRFAKEKEFRVEIVTDFGGFWYNKNQMHIRASKFENLIKHAKNKDNVVILAVDLKNKKFMTMKFGEDMKATFIEKHGAFGKPVYEIEIDAKKELKDIELLDNKNYLLSLLSRGYIVIIIDIRRKLKWKIKKNWHFNIISEKRNLSENVQKLQGLA